MRVQDIFGEQGLTEAQQTDALTFNDSCVGSHHGQSDMVLSAWIGTERVGTIDYSIYDGEIAVKMIAVEKPKRGYGTALAKELQRRYPDDEIDWGGTTDEGTVLLRSLPFREVPNEDVQAKMAQLADARAREARFAAEWKRYEDDPTPANRPAWADSSDAWNDAHDEISQLEHELHGKHPVKRLIVF